MSLVVMLTEPECEVCLDQNDECEACCPHLDADEYCCLVCGKDLTEDRASRAYDRFKDKMKYGE